MAHRDKRQVCLTAAGAVCVLAACSSSEPAPSGPPATSVFDPGVTTVAFEIDYAPGAEPYLEVIKGGRGEPFGLFRENVNALLAARPKTLEIPASLSSMELLPDLSATSYTRDDIVQIADKHRGSVSTNSTLSYYLLFLNGVYSADGTDSPGTLALSLRSRGIIAIFKPSIRTNVEANKWKTGSGKLVEQLALVHEFGHAIGLVNNGVPLQSPHQDEAYGHHCVDPMCIMHWNNENFDNLLDFVKRVVADESTTTFDAQCLGDVRAMR